MAEHTSDDIHRAFGVVTDALLTVQKIGERPAGAELLEELHSLAVNHAEAFDSLVGGKAGLLAQVQAAFPDENDEGDEEELPGRVIHIDP